MHVEIILDSQSPGGTRVTTIHCRYPRFIHAQVMTHRVFSRNARSSRAVPVLKMIDEVRNSPVLPNMAANKRGMQPGEVFPAWKQEAAKGLWVEAAKTACDYADSMVRLGVHKQWANRILEPFMEIDTLITATDWDNFFNLRCHDDAQIEIAELACEIREAMWNSNPEERVEHVPYVEHGAPWDYSEEEFSRLQMISAARCARISYKPFNEATANEEKDLQLAQRLWDDGHLSPFEHIASASFPEERNANLKGWFSLRTYKEEQLPYV